MHSRIMDKKKGPREGPFPVSQISLILPYFTVCVMGPATPELLLESPE